ncbi:MAG: lysophospholipase [Firmicutes bacterium]|nr:lysophospholipase [Bacillota bacterium]
MTDHYLRRSNGYAIPYSCQISGDGQPILLMIHGFGSSKASSTVRLFAAAMEKSGKGWISFDLPAHGDSPVDGSKLRVANCLEDLHTVESYLSRAYPHSPVAYLGSSFGAYLLALHLSKHGRPHRKAVLRCAAVKMAQLMIDEQTPEQARLLRAQGFVILDEDYARPLKITNAFIDDLLQHDLFAEAGKNMADMLMIHGTADQIAPIADARSFARHIDAPLVEIEGANHTFDAPGQMDRLVSIALDFFGNFC